MKKEYRKRLTDTEFNAISNLTLRTHLDESFDVDTKKNGDDGFYNCETGRIVSLKTGLQWLYEGIAYPLSHEKLTAEETELIIGLFKEFGITDNDEYFNWLRSEDVA